jgi:hypothetical protein
MKGTTYEATVQDGRVVLPEEAHIPDNTASMWSCRKPTMLIASA